MGRFDQDDLEEMAGELEQLREAHRKRLQEARGNPSGGVPDEVKAGLRRIRELERDIQDAEQQIAERISSGAPRASSGGSDERRASG